MKLLKILSLFLIALSGAFSKDIFKHKFEIFGGFNMNYHIANFNKLAGVPNCCPLFSNGFGRGYNFGFGYEHKLYDKFWVSVLLGFISLDGTLTKDEPTTIITPNGPIRGLFEHKMNGKFNNLGFEPSFGYNLLDNLFINFGARFGFNLTQTYEQMEIIKEPKGIGTFVDSLGNDTGLRIRNHFSGTIPNSNKIQIFIFGGITYELPLNKYSTFRLSPEIQFYYPISEIAKNTKWKTNSLRFGLSIKYTPRLLPEKQRRFEKRNIIDTIKVPSDVFTQMFKPGLEIRSFVKHENDSAIIDYEIVARTDTIFIPKTYKLTGSIFITGKDKSGYEIEQPIFKVEEIISNRMDPLLNYIFFEENSFVIPKRYKTISKEETHTFSEINLFRDSTLEIYYNILNIIGKRLRDNPSATISIVGCNSDYGVEKGNLELSFNRAKEVKNYFVNVWGIEEYRIKIEYRNLPAKPSIPKDEKDKMEENRRVEIYASDEKILQPIFIEKVDRITDPPTASFKIEAISEAGLKEWKIVAYQPSDTLNKFEYFQQGNAVEQVDWKLAQYQKLTPKFPEPIIGELHLWDNKGNYFNTKALSKPVEVVTIKDTVKRILGNFELEKYSLILFDFNKATIEGLNKKIVDFISKRLKADSEIEIIGYTDRTGTPDYNKHLSEQRAKSVKNALKRNNAVSYGLGQEILLFDNNLPEGRFYCRTVDIIVKTKINK